MGTVSDIVAEMREEYLASCRTHLSEIRYNLGAPAAQADDLEDVQRTVHSIKGSAYTFGLAELSVLCAAWESEMKRARLAGDVDTRHSQWNRFADIYAAMLSGTSAPASSAADAAGVLVWSPFESSRDKLAPAARSIAHKVIVAGTDREALIIASQQPIVAIIGDTSQDSELDSEQRASLVGAAAAGLGVPWFCADLDAERHPTFVTRGAQPLPQ